jgi:hypothetical protein
VPAYLDVTLTVELPSLKTRRRSPAQLELLRQVVFLREGKKMTFKGIALRLAEQGYCSPRRKGLSAELVFSIYKKRPTNKSSL